MHEVSESRYFIHLNMKNEFIICLQACTSAIEEKYALFHSEIKNLLAYSTSVHDLSFSVKPFLTIDCRTENGNMRAMHASTALRDSEFDAEYRNDVLSQCGEYFGEY